MSNPIIELQNKIRNNSSNNPLQNNPGIQQVLQMKRMVQAAQNPQQALNQMLMNNPQVANAIQFIKNNGGDPKTAFLNYANQLGVNPQEIINILNS